MEYRKLQKEAEDRLNEFMTVIQFQPSANLSAKVGFYFRTH